MKGHPRKKPVQQTQGNWSASEWCDSRDRHMEDCYPRAPCCHFHQLLKPEDRMNALGKLVPSASVFGLRWASAEVPTLLFMPSCLDWLKIFISPKTCSGYNLPLRVGGGSQWMTLAQQWKTLSRFFPLPTFLLNVQYLAHTKCFNSVSHIFHRTYSELCLLISS